MDSDGDPWMLADDLAMAVWGFGRSLDSCRLAKAENHVQCLHRGEITRLETLVSGR